MNINGSRFIYEIEDTPRELNIYALAPQAIPKVNQKALLLEVINKRGSDGWEYCGLDPMGNMLFRCEESPVMTYTVDTSPEACRNLTDGELEALGLNEK